MEQKKTLWIVAAAGIFLLVVVGAALIIYSPSLHNAPVQQASFDPSTGWVNASALTESQTQDSSTPAPDSNSFSENQDSTLPASPFDPLAENYSQNNKQENSELAQADKNAAQNSSDSNANAIINAQNVNVYTQETTTFDLNALKSASSNSNVVAQNEKTAEQIKAASQEKSAKSEQENYYTPSSTANSSAKSSSSKSSSIASAKTSSSSSTASKSASTKASSSKSSSASTKATSSAKAASSTTAKKVAEVAKTPANLYWVQVGAYSSKKNADSARETLEENKIPVEVFTDAKYFKVRAGSYQTKSEAEYWQNIISKIDKFAGSKTLVVNSAVQN